MQHASECTWILVALLRLHESINTSEYRDVHRLDGNFEVLQQLRGRDAAFLCFGRKVLSIVGFSWRRVCFINAMSRVSGSRILALGWYHCENIFSFHSVLWVHENDTSNFVLPCIIEFQLNAETIHAGEVTGWLVWTHRHIKRGTLLRGWLVVFYLWVVPRDPSSLGLLYISGEGLLCCHQPKNNEAHWSSNRLQ